eukprot:m.29772 g.29772  ORF g.29772 m.29772 type:complete len:349 (-) comp13777_c0_seq1:247-1293(-)
MLQSSPSRASLRSGSSRTLQGVAEALIEGNTQSSFGVTRMQFAPPVVVSSESVRKGEAEVSTLGQLLHNGGIKMHPRLFDSILNVVPIEEQDVSFVERLQDERIAADNSRIPHGKDRSTMDKTPMYLWSVVPARELDTYWQVSDNELSLSRGHVSKAVAKLREALKVTRCGETVKAMGDVIDIGAAPGSWTEHLSGLARRVIAIDPGALAPSVIQLPNVVHIRKKSQDAVAEVQRLLHRDHSNDTLPPSEASPSARALHSAASPDLVVCDMNVPPHEAIAACLRIIEQLRPGCRMLITMKFIGSGRDRDVVLQECKRQLGALVYADSVRFVWLFANTLHERLLVATKA